MMQSRFNLDAIQVQLICNLETIFFVDFWIFGFLDMWIFGFVDLLICGFVDLWIFYDL